MFPHEAKIRAGVATEDITPDDPVPMSGYGAREDPSTGVHDRLSATALVVDDGARTVAFLSADLLNVSRELTHRVRRQLAADGVVLDELVLAATHTHAGPYIPARALDISPPLRTETDVSAILETIERAFVRTLTRASERLEPAQIRVGRASEARAQHNRRAAGGVGGNVRLPHGPVDPEVTALLVDSVSGERTVLYNFACHPVCTTPSERLLSADWPGYARQRIEADHDAHVLFFNGAAGDINPGDSADSGADDGVYDHMETIGTQVGDAVCRAIDDAESGSVIERAAIRTEGVEVQFPLKDTPAVETITAHIADLETRLESLEAAGEETGSEKLNWDRRYAEELLAIAEWDATRLPNRVPYVEIGPVGILGMPGEILTRHGLTFKDRARAETLVLAGYANDYVGYVPTLADLEQVGYEVRTMKIAPEAVVEFREAALDLVSGGRGADR